jgi:hypothetical protein
MIKIDFTSGGGNNAFLDDFELSVTLDSEELSAEKVQISPNPSNGSFSVEGLPVGTSYRILSIDGRFIQQGQLNNLGAIDVNAAAGYYIFQAGPLRKSFIIN